MALITGSAVGDFIHRNGDGLSFGGNEINTVTASADTINAGSGADMIYADAGADTVDGEDGNGTIAGGQGAGTQIQVTGAPPLTGADFAL